MRAVRFLIGRLVLAPTFVGAGIAARHAFTLLDGSVRLRFVQLIRSEGPLLALVALAAIAGSFFPVAGEAVMGALVLVPSLELNPSVNLYPQNALFGAFLFGAVALAGAPLFSARAVSAMVGRAARVDALGLRASRG